ncbi:hypothetical protein GGX14DRAFT_667630 [Mycena pura]|uniref:Uncharacterized protein n=1 Tax=Mycena pura TaxID=153505 RepID=A0AAD6UYY1_9AGAR|nr:hypothetical protein GGX14DRAFT_667630 [Mycena pura]
MVGNAQGTQPREEVRAPQCLLAADAIAGKVEHELRRDDGWGGREPEVGVRQVAKQMWKGRTNEAEMSVQCSSGISVKSMHGNSFDRAVVPSVPLDQIDRTTTNARRAQAACGCSNCAAVYSGYVFGRAPDSRHDTGASHRVHSRRGLRAADARALAVLLAKQATQRTVVLSLADRRDKLFQVVADVCAAYAAVHKTHTTSVRLMLPAVVPELVRDVFGAEDYEALRSGFWKDRAPRPRNLNLAEQVLEFPVGVTSAWWVQYGLYLMDDRQDVLLWIGRIAIPELVRDVFGVEDYEALRSGKIKLPVLETGVSQSARALVCAIRGRTNGVHYPSMYVMKDNAASDLALRTAVAQALVHDRIDELRLRYK